MLPAITKAHFSYKDSTGTKTVPVDFNPATLEYSITVSTQGEGGQAQQAASASSAKLNFELIFDTTDTGEDVRSKTHLVELMLQTTPGKGTNPPPQVLSEVTFEWGVFKFVGVVDSYKQSMDFFSADGVPLRATVTLSMSQPKYKFDQAGTPRGPHPDQPFSLPGGDPSQIAAAAGDPAAARSIAAANNLESLRADAPGELSIGTVGAAVAAGAGAITGLGDGFSNIVGSGTSAGVAAAAGAFGGLHTGKAAPSGKSLNTDLLRTAASAAAISTQTLFDVTGRALAQGSTFKTEVGATKGLQFDDNP